MADAWLDAVRWEFEQAQIEGMFMPVRCTHCQRIYDAGKVEVTARYADCSVWKAPCCGLTVDDRKPPWKNRADYKEIRR